MALIKCPECGKKISDQTNQCPNCGRTITDADKELAIEQNKKSKKHKKIALIVIIVILLAGVAGGVTYYFVQENNKRVEEQKKAEAKKKAEEEKKKKEIAEQKQRRQNKRDFVKLTGDLFDSTDKFVSNLSNISIKATHTWSNAIWKEKSKETNKWTLKKNGKFRDFSDAVNLCISDTVYSNKTAKQYEKFKETYSKWEKLKSDDYIYNEYKDICEDTENYCNAIHSLYSLLASPTGNYDDFSTSITNAENDIKIYAESLSSDIFKLYH